MNPINPNNLINIAINQNLLAFRIIKSYLNNPSLAGVTIYQENLQKTYPAKISKQVIIDNTGGRKVIHDNFQLDPIGWRLKGYLKAYPYEMSFYFQPSLRTQVTQLEEARDNRDIIEFKDQNGKVFDVGIEKLVIDEVAEARNVVPITLELTNITTQETGLILLEKEQKTGDPIKGTTNGESSNEGTTTGEKTKDSTPLYKIWTGLGGSG